MVYLGNAIDKVEVKEKRIIKIDGGVSKKGVKSVEKDSKANEKKVVEHNVEVGGINIGEKLVIRSDEKRIRNNSK